MQEASSEDNISHLKIWNLKVRTLKSGIQHQEEENLFEFKNKILKCHIWLIALYGAKNCALLKVVQIYLGRFEM
jgi:hypothetical protein